MHEFLKQQIVVCASAQDHYKRSQKANEQRSVDMKIGNTLLRKPSQAGRDECMKKVLSLQRRKKGHLAKAAQMRNWKSKRSKKTT